MQRDLVTRENSVKFRGWFSSHALGFVDALPNDCKDELKIAELRDHGKECFHLEHGFLVHSDLDCFRNPSTATSIRRENFLFSIALERNLWPLNPMVGIWNLIERNISGDFVHNVHELSNRVKIHWTRLMGRDDLFERLAADSIEQMLNKIDLN